MFPLTKTCLLTGWSIINSPKEAINNGIEIFYYDIYFFNEKIRIGLCETFIKQLQHPNSEASLYIKKNRVGLVAKWSRDGFQSLRSKVIHWDCYHAPAEHVQLKDFVKTESGKPDDLISRKEKIGLIENFIYESQEYDGEWQTVPTTSEFFAQFQIQTKDELGMLLAKISESKRIAIRGGFSVQMTYEGLEYHESKNVINTVSENGRYHIALSFAGEDRKYVKGVADELEKLGLSVFYDDFEKVQLWGKDLYQHLNEVYKDRCQYCIVFVSEAYSKKVWTKHEFKSAQARAIKENSEYILPVRFDSTELPGLNETIGYIDANSVTPLELAEMAKMKINSKN